ncbi:uncharacterized protein LOC132030538 isoform X1 [Lycium ferocissimum]|uniref:uncharacterized protein LOC132030538 isoform X1 n=1 Tax=Lycium ferocissimum TaxID=112874 RepID=UPI0028150833|nr:uncharacterized protein LOC132030538 isoform X1 [Lycium ferocissimum]
MGKKSSSSRKKGVGGSITLRQELGGIGKKKQTHVNPKSMLKLEHIKNLATWASGEASIPSLAAFFGQRLAASTELLGVPPDPSLFTCQRCESILQAGYSCTARIEKNKRKARKKRKTSGIPPKNCVVYECHFCSDQNLKRGTPRGYVKTLFPAKPKTSRVDPAKSATRKSEQLDTLGASIDKARVNPTESAMRKCEQLDPLVANIGKVEVGPTESAVQKSEQFEASVSSTDKDNKTDVVVSSEIVGDDPMASPATPLPTVPVTSLLDSKRKKRYRTGSKKKVEPQDGSSRTDAEKIVATSSKRKKKSWTSLKEIAESQSSNSRKFSNISVPFIL